MLYGNAKRYLHVRVQNSVLFSSPARRPRRVGVPNTIPLFDFRYVKMYYSLLADVENIDIRAHARVCMFTVHTGRTASTVLSFMFIFFLRPYTCTFTEILYFETKCLSRFEFHATGTKTTFSQCCFSSENLTGYYSILMCVRASRTSNY